MSPSRHLLALIPNPARPPRGVFLCLLLTSLLPACQTKPAQPTPTTLPSVLTPAAPLTSVQAIVAPPVGWTAEPLKQSDSHTHQVWLSPSKHTAYGVIHMRIPLPVSANFLLPFYMRAWRNDQGEATLLHKVQDPTLPGVRFVAEGGLYKTWSNLTTSGLNAWCAYAGTLRAHPIDEPELQLAEQAREHTRPGLN